jgi:hypothetical protein
MWVVRYFHVNGTVSLRPTTTGILERARSFLDVIIHTDYTEVRPKDALHRKWEVLPDVPDLLGDDPPIYVFLHDDTMAFWQECITVVDMDGFPNRVATS